MLDLVYHFYSSCGKLVNSNEVTMDYIYIMRIKNLREDSEKSQQQIADILGTSQTMYSRYERGINEMPFHHILTLARYYNVSLDYLGGTTKRKRPFPKE